jgi:DNA-3-methyladenine glycosylase II
VAPSQDGASRKSLAGSDAGEEPGRDIPGRHCETTGGTTWNKLDPRSERARRPRVGSVQAGGPGDDRDGGARASRASHRQFELRPRPPFRLDLTAWALRRREQNAIDTWDGRTYRRALLIAGRPIVVAVTQSGGTDAPRLEVQVSGQRRASFTQATVTEALTRLLGLELDLSGFYTRAAADPALAPLAARYRGVKAPRFPTPFESLVNAVACQQLSLAAGLTVLSRLTAAASPAAAGLHPFPAPQDVLQLSVPALKQMGFSERKVHTILHLARAAASGEFELERLESLDDGEIVRALVQHPGIGRWSADYVLLRGLGRLHVFPQADIGALNGLRRFLTAAGSDDDPAAALARWQPDAGTLYFHLLLRSLQERGTLPPEAP